jgi:drug/metabolite transporter (DMT)-like permease
VEPVVKPAPLLLWPLIATGILAISCASLFIRLASAPALTIALYRTALAALVLLPYWALRRSRIPPSWSLQAGLLTAAAGLFLALHFVFWIQSLQRTSVASSVILVSTTPLFVALLSPTILRERLHGRLWAGILVTVAGCVIVAGADTALAGDALWGDLLALLGALMAAGYLLTGRVVRRQLDLAAYSLGAYGAAAALLVLACLATPAPLQGFSAQTYWMLVLLALVPQLLGHTTFNWTLKFLSPTLVSLLILGEPIGATLLAYIFLDERVGSTKLLGIITVGAGIALAALAPSPPKAPAAPPCGSAIEVDNPRESQ